MSLYKTFKMDEKLEQEGIWLEYGVTSEGKPIRFKVTRSGGTNQAFAKRLEAAFKPYRRALQTETMDDKLADKILKEVFSTSIVKTWENVQDENGKNLPFNSDNFVKVMTDLPELWADLREQCNKAALFRLDATEIAAKN